METNTVPPTNSVPPVQQTSPVVPQEQSTSNGMAILAYLGILIIIPFLTEAHKNPFVKFHIKQGLVLIILWVASGIVASIPGLGLIVGPILWLAAFVLMIVGIVSAASGKMKELPLIGQFARHFTF